MIYVIFHESHATARLSIYFNFYYLFIILLENRNIMGMYTVNTCSDISVVARQSLRVIGKSRRIRRHVLSLRCEYIKFIISIIYIFSFISYLFIFFSYFTRIRESLIFRINFLTHYVPLTTALIIIVIIITVYVY